MYKYAEGRRRKLTAKYLSNVVSLITSYWILIYIFLIEIPMGLLTLSMMRKSVKRTRATYLITNLQSRQIIPVTTDRKEMN